MPLEPLAAAELTQRLITWQRAPTQDPAATVAAARDACDLISVEFSRWVGARGYEALMSRALSETRRVHPALDEIRYEIRSDPVLGGVDESIQRYGADATGKGLEALVEMILALLTRLIGSEIVATLAERSMENWRRDELGHLGNLDQRSAGP